MSSTFFPSPSELALLQIPINCEFALATIGLYDYTLTFDRELQYIWRYKFNWVSALFCVNRYLVPLTSALIFWKNTSSAFTGRACTAMVLSQMIVDIMMSVCAAIFYAVQAFALFNRGKVLLVFTLAFGLATPIITLCVWSIAASRSLETNTYGQRCSSLAVLITGTYDGWLVAARVASLAANCLIMILIIIKCCKITRYTGGVSLTALLIEQGTLFLVAMALPNIVGIGLGKISVLEANIPLHNEVTTSILINRFILTLRAQQSLTSTEDLGSTVVFASRLSVDDEDEECHQAQRTVTIYSDI